MIIYIDGKLDRDELTFDEMLALPDASPLPPLSILFWYDLAYKYGGLSVKAAA